MLDADLQVLQEAIERNAGVVLSLPSAGVLRHYKSRFLEGHNGEITVEAVSNEKALIDQLITSGQPVGVSFKSGDRKIIFAAPVCRYQEEFSLNNQLRVDAMMLMAPEHVKSVQRRTEYRVAVALESGIRVRMWRIPEWARLDDQPQPAQEIPVRIRDLSVGGMGVVFLPKPDNKAPMVLQSERVRIEMACPECRLLLEGRMAHVPANPQSNDQRGGVVFKKPPADARGQQITSILTRMVAELQRQEVRRYRRQITNTDSKNSKYIM